MNTRDVLQSVTFGQRVAEQESESLASYFVETDQWRRLYAGHVDIVYGPKGSGKSAFYFLLLNRSNDLFDRGIILAAGENPQGAPAFKDLVKDPPASEEEFRALWKLYLLTLVGEQIREYGISNGEAKQVLDALAEAGLVEPRASLARRIGAVLSYVRAMLPAESVEGGIAVPEPSTGLPIGISGKITFREPSPVNKASGFISIDDLFAIADDALRSAGLSLWVVIDRLDVAFAETPELEKNALRALFRVYVDLLVLKNISIKIFLRDDIWSRITADGFREASHVTRSLTISWDEASLLNLVVRRALTNTSIRERYSVDEEQVLASIDRQRDLYYRMVPRQVDVGEKKPSTLKWMLTRTSDAFGVTAPRELIHLLEETRAEQLRRLERGEADPADEALLSAAALKSALPEVSKVRLEQTIYAEYPEMKKYIAALDGRKTQQNLESLAEVWALPDVNAARAVAQALVDIAFFESTGSHSEPSFKVPFLYRDALNLVQGTAD